MTCLLGRPRSEVCILQSLSTVREHFDPTGQSTIFLCPSPAKFCGRRPPPWSGKRGVLILCAFRVRFTVHIHLLA